MWKIPDIVEIQRGLNHASDDVLEQFVSTLDTSEIRYILTCYLKQFVPYWD